MPNFDYPSFNKNTIIKNCKSEKLCLIWIENENNYLIKNNENDNIKNIYNKKIKKKNEIKKFKYKKDFNNNNNNLNYDEICILF